MKSNSPSRFALAWQEVLTFSEIYLGKMNLILLFFDTFRFLDVILRLWDDRKHSNLRESQHFQLRCVLESFSLCVMVKVVAQECTRRTRRRPSPTRSLPYSDEVVHNRTTMWRPQIHYREDYQETIGRHSPVRLLLRLWDYCSVAVAVWTDPCEDRWTPILQNRECPATGTVVDRDRPYRTLRAPVQNTWPDR